MTTKERLAATARACGWSVSYGWMVPQREAIKVTRGDLIAWIAFGSKGDVVDAQCSTLTSGGFEPLPIIPTFIERWLRTNGVQA